MPSLTFELPHWVYWSGLVLLPFVGILAVWRSRQHPPKAVSLAVAYLLWLCGGFAGLHRFYVRSKLGLVYIPLLVAILWGNVQAFDARTALSAARDELIRAEFDVERFGQAAAEGEEGAAGRLAEAEQAVAAVRQQVVAATAAHERWRTITGGIALLVALLLVIDAFLLPRLVRRQAAREPGEVEWAEIVEARPAGEAPARGVHTPFTDSIDAISRWTGEFVAYWSVIAVFVYYFEVISRYVFNSPTNWAHESMFLMFGMQYLISGAYALREDAHVRVDVIYLHLSNRAKAITDILTSIFFFIFSITLLITGWTFMMDSVAVWEVSFTEWAIQYWPIKISIVVGAALITLQGVSNLIKDLILLIRPGA
jgi:TRAP-type mannitol/chloroaromatic compound transport system permease small subunit